MAAGAELFRAARTLRTLGVESLRGLSVAQEAKMLARDHKFGSFCKRQSRSFGDRQVLRLRIVGGPGYLSQHQPGPFARPSVSARPPASLSGPLLSPRRDARSALVFRPR